MKKFIYLICFFFLNTYIKLFADDGSTNSGLAKSIIDAVDAESKTLDSMTSVVENGGSIHQALYGLVGLVFIFQMASIVIKNLLEPEVFSFAKLKKPLILFGVLTCFYSIDYFVRDIVAGAVREYVQDNQKSVAKNTEKSIKDLDIMEKKLKELRSKRAAAAGTPQKYYSDKHQKSVYYTKDEKGNVIFTGDVWTYNNAKKDKNDKEVQEFIQEAKQDIEGNSSWINLDKLEEIAIRIKYLDEFIMYSILSWCMKVVSFFDTLLLAGFFVFQWIWLKILAMGAPIALVISALSGGWSNLITWGKTYVSTSLWYVVASYCVDLVNLIQARVSVNFISTVQKATDTVAAIDPALGMTASIGSMLSLITQLFVLSLLFFILKLILIGKVPAMISSFISGGNAAAEGFSGGFAPLSAARGAAGVGFAAATGGASAVGQVGGNLIKGGK